MTHANFRIFATDVGLPATVAKIEGFGALPPGWHYGRGDATSQENVDAALRVIDRLTMFGFAETDAFPGSGGEILVTGYWGDHCVEILIDGNRFNVAYEHNGVEIDSADGLSEAGALQKLSDTARSIWHTSAFSTQDILIVKEAASQALHSKTQHWVAFPSFGASALTIQARPFVSTSPATIVELPAILRFFGGSTSRNSLRRSA